MARHYTVREMRVLLFERGVVVSYETIRRWCEKILRMNPSRPLYHRHRYPAAVIACAVRWYFRFQLSLRDIEELGARIEKP